MLIDAERPREGLDDLLAYATYVVSSAKFPQTWTSAPTVAEALLQMLVRLPRLKFVIVTLGASGCIMLERHTPDSTEAGMEDDAVEVNELLESLTRQAGELRDSHPTAVSSKVRRLSSADSSDGQQQIWGRFHVGTAEVIPASELVDTTGAGDGFIGGVMFAILAGLSPQKLLALGATVASLSGLNPQLKAVETVVNIPFVFCDLMIHFLCRSYLISSVSIKMLHPLSISTY
ncbi:hypothetical protein KC19_5G045900 [Ceratodon purpureus]|uniref:Carbohydrate kinase PfkB domain-containing protein n=1 Tax=Ceratodon purpureus TaxID=3225 RepID=A0A8T0HXZ3_CERPU|nr:hypothetical protein KC19_5G045900 [Ceratodon purpureus]